jgi:hypothetical protein
MQCFPELTAEVIGSVFAQLRGIGFHERFVSLKTLQTEKCSLKSRSPRYLLGF